MKAKYTDEGYSIFGGLACHVVCWVIDLCSYLHQGEGKARVLVPHRKKRMKGNAKD
jgi:hypothetical protein